MKKLVNVLSKKERFSTPPVWVMRQAGRYLPEYLETRSQAGSFLNLCYNPKLASEVTLQPIRRFDFDAAIIFSDILVIPDALGVKVDFVKNEGPKLGDFELKNLKTKNIAAHLAPVFEALELTRSKLDKEKALIGFSGAPWTMACYMIEKGGSKNFENVRRFAVENEAEFSQLIDILTESVIEYLSLQIKAGVDVVKIFDSWAGVLPPSELNKWIFEPAKKIIQTIKKNHPQIPLIYFPRGIGANYADFARDVAPHGLAIDQTVEKNWAKENLQQKNSQVIQGNLDNILLAFGKKSEIEKEVMAILETFGDHPFIFNLGHGILPQTPIENLELVLKTIRKK